jgi:crotonobetainyl-CoA:carnitine CoA-transferase CaiB-like acyl-CoA transferase
VIPNFQIGDLVGGSLSAVMGILAAIVDAQRSGEGRYVDVAMTDCTLAHALFPLISLLDCGRTRPRGEDFVSGGLPCYAIYETADGRHMAVAALEEKFWTLCCTTLDRPDLAERYGVFDTEAEAVRNEVAAVFRTRTQSEWVQRFKEVDCCVTPVLTLAETMHNEQIQARNMVVTAKHPVDGSITQFAFPVKFSDFEFSIDRHAPAPGEHSEEILAQAGFHAERIGKLRADGII